MVRIRPRAAEERKVYYEANKIRILAQMKAHYDSHREEMQSRSRAQRLKGRYGLTMKEYEEQYYVQNGCCFLCGKEEKVKGRMLAVDHNHQTGNNRKLLCYACNNLVGSLEKANKSGLLERMLVYIAREGQV